MDNWQIVNKGIVGCCWFLSTCGGALPLMGVWLLTIFPRKLHLGKSAFQGGPPSV